MKRKKLRPVGRPVKEMDAEDIELRPYISANRQESPAMFNLLSQYRIKGGINKLIYQLLEQYDKESRMPPDQVSSFVPVPQPATPVIESQEVIKLPTQITNITKEVTPEENKPPKKLSGFLARAKESN
jgi:hypothetical protein